MVVAAAAQRRAKLRLLAADCGGGGGDGCSGGGCGWHPLAELLPTPAQLLAPGVRSDATRGSGAHASIAPPPKASACATLCPPERPGAGAWAGTEGPEADTAELRRPGSDAVEDDVDKDDDVDITLRWCDLGPCSLPLPLVLGPRIPPDDDEDKRAGATAAEVAAAAAAGPSSWEMERT